MKVTLDWDPLPHQLEFLQWTPGPDAPKGPVTCGALGGWGSGKTHGIALAFILACLRQGWHPGYGKLLPQAQVIAPNLSLAIKNQLELIDSLLPPELVKRRWGRPEPRLLLANGVEIRALSADSAIEGGNWVACWVDEIDKPCYADHPERLTNWTARLRDPKARDPHPRMFISGLPTAGFVRKLLDRPDDASRMLRRWSMNLNTKLAPGLREQILRKTPAGEEMAFLDGCWQQIPNALFPQYNEALHLVDDDGNRAQAVDIALDVGNRSNLLVGQRQKVKGSTDVRLHVVDEVIGAGLSAEQQIHEFRTKGWLVDPARSTVSVDPTLRRDEIHEVYAAFPGVEVVQRKRTDDLHDVMRGIRLVQTALKNTKGEIRLTINRRLAGNQKGVVDAMTHLRFNDRTGSPMVQDTYDHAGDSLRYLACTVLGPQLAPVVVS
ncbi:MAG: hypothetical protein IPG45_05965 [Deltaproteobacteria bacterium]|nr:hypothetical protein [Deltaproteobacteria bacterium]